MRKVNIRGKQQVGKSSQAQGIMFLLIFCLALYLFLQSSLFNIKTIVVTGNTQLSSATIISLSGLTSGSNILRANVKEAEQNISAHPLVETVRIYRELPSTIYVKITERTPMALLPVPEGFIEVSPKAVYLRKVHKIGEKPLPLITGIQPPLQLFPGHKIDNEKLEVALEVLSQIPDKLQNLFVEIDVSNPNDIVLYPPNGLQVRLGDKYRIREKLEVLNGLNVELRTIGEKEVEYVDISFEGLPVVKFKER